MRERQRQVRRPARAWMSTARFWSSAQQPKAKTGSRRPLGLRRSFLGRLSSSWPCALFESTFRAYLIDEDNSGDGSSGDHSIVAKNGHVDGVEQSICMTSHELDDMQVALKDSQREKGYQLLQKFSKNRKLNHHISAANVTFLC